ncbi:hypothetical protein [Salipiger sp.]
MSRIAANALLATRTALLSDDHKETYARERGYGGGTGGHEGAGHDRPQH